MTYKVTWYSHWIKPQVYLGLTKQEADTLVWQGRESQYRVEVIEENSVEYHAPAPAHYIPTGLSGICTDGFGS